MFSPCSGGNTVSKDRLLSTCMGMNQIRDFEHDVCGPALHMHGDEPSFNPYFSGAILNIEVTSEHPHSFLFCKPPSQMIVIFHFAEYDVPITDFILFDIPRGHFEFILPSVSGFFDL